MCFTFIPFGNKTQVFLIQPTYLCIPKQSTLHWIQKIESMRNETVCHTMVKTSADFVRYRWHDIQCRRHLFCFALSVIIVSRWQSMYECVNMYVISWLLSYIVLQWNFKDVSAHTQLFCRPKLQIASNSFWVTEQRRIKF